MVRLPPFLLLVKLLLLSELLPVLGYIHSSLEKRLLPFLVLPLGQLVLLLPLRQTRLPVAHLVVPGQIPIPEFPRSFHRRLRKASPLGSIPYRPQCLLCFYKKITAGSFLLPVSLLGRTRLPPPPKRLQAAPRPALRPAGYRLLLAAARQQQFVRLPSLLPQQFPQSQ